jgi:polynucleotide 5'-hydroxyl-kinase GRC3/NOL9
MRNPADEFDIGEEVRERILASEECVIMLIGGSDTGKTTLVERIADWLARSGNVAVVDADMGQSHIGPPTTIGWGLVNGKFAGWDAVETEGFYFVGATSPYRNLLPTVVGTKLMCDDAKLRARFVIVDTTGLATGKLGCILKWSKIDAIRPDVLLAIQRGDELEPVLAPYRHTESPATVTMRTPEAVGSKTVDQRTAYRERMFARYFEGSDVAELSGDRVSVRWSDTVPSRGLENLVDGLVSLRDGDGRDVALGIIVEIDVRRNLFLVRTPLTCQDDVAAVVVGDLYISPDGKQLEAR